MSSKSMFSLTASSNVSGLTATIEEMIFKMEILRFIMYQCHIDIDVGLGYENSSSISVSEKSVD